MPTSSAAPACTRCRPRRRASGRRGSRRPCTDVRPDLRPRPGEEEGAEGAPQRGKGAFMASTVLVAAPSQIQVCSHTPVDTSMSTTRLDDAFELPLRPRAAQRMPTRGRSGWRTTTWTTCCPSRARAARRRAAKPPPKKRPAAPQPSRRPRLRTTTTTRGGQGGAARAAAPSDEPGPAAQPGERPGRELPLSLPQAARAAR